MTWAVHGADIHIVVRGPQSPTMAAALEPMTFGLTARQINNIRLLTNVDFGDYYYTRANEERLQAMRVQPGFVDRVRLDMPPPGFLNVGSYATTPGDPQWTDQWWVGKLGVVQAWPMATGQGVVIADCDAGYYHDEPDLFSNMLLEQRYDLSDRDQPWVVNDGAFTSHGTSVAAIMVGVLNGTGTNGIAYNAKLVPFQNYNYDANDDLDKEEATAACVLRAIATPHVSVLVLENQTADGSSETFAPTRDAVRLAQQAGLIVVSAAGNGGLELSREKMDDTGSIIVGALSEDDSVPYWSNYGERITIAAYGEKLRTLAKPGGVFDYFGGTSGATPQVAATVALMKEAQPMLTPAQARDILRKTALPLPAGKNVGGRLFVPTAVAMARNQPVDFHSVNKQWLLREQLRVILH